MNEAMVEKIVQAVLYEGYNLYPYRPSVKTAAAGRSADCTRGPTANPRMAPMPGGCRCNAWFKASKTPP